MPYRKLIALITLLAAMVVTPALAAHQKPVHDWINARNLYAHNYGPGFWPGTIATYDGPTRALCKQGAAAYRGQNGRRHPCH
uniref:Uncharacterized protein n=1 Tax=Rhodopseudomonas palustris (strain BisA53) TaxID=316055 RepID=Q07JK2_RHOP5